MKYRIFFSCLFIWFIPQLAIANEFKCNQTLRMAIGTQREPFVIQKNTTVSGFDIDLLRAVVKQTGCKLKLVNNKDLTWEKRLKMIKRGELDIASGASWDNNRAEWAHYSFPYRNEYAGIYIKKSDENQFANKTLPELLSSSFTLGVTKGNTYGSKIDTLLASHKNQLYFVTDSSDFYPLLSQGKIDGFIGYPVTEIIQLIRNKLDDKFSLHYETVIKTGQVHYLLSKKTISPELFNAFNSALVALRSNGDYDKIVKKYSISYGISTW
ncbi:substrate-binding periplasmic protein [Spartinivicinus poritis]|uniref:Transporter substrate-binding domain-containing protein n=1 Tax=Spartinivicinus poritis TaxID=2994640 RepID=A0ABT5U5V8_9GAMM|nr:transporter substrate-binding domain-containing protein [Spartinivicinus sp. A2-2]MDE1460574.1 transporter substrate-binding domain-containing protein [Spartinivicinus sp. A2-2]